MFLKHRIQHLNDPKTDPINFYYDKKKGKKIEIHCLFFVVSYFLPSYHIAPSTQYG